MKPPPLFVYGSLMRGETNAGQLQGATFLAQARTAPSYTLVDMGDYPALCGGGVTSVAGELYQLEAGMLERLDAFEGHPQVYRRSHVTLADSTQAEAYLHAGAAPPAGPVIPGGDWRRR
jgi:gamma-glutamylcyclotransferase (GGCT)/AIG2-like uncharacterized protein YtfP